MSRFPFYNKFPYTNIGDINLDWIIKQVKRLQDRVDNLDPEDFSERLEQVETLAEQANQNAFTAANTAADAEQAAAGAVTTANATATTVDALPADSNPLMDGTVSPGTSAKLSRADHVHPHDTANDVISLNLGTITELPFTFTNAAIKSDMVVVGFWLSNPKNMVSYWTVNTSDGSLTITGSIAGNGTSCRIKLAKGV